MKKFLFSLLLSCFAATSLWAQNATADDDDSVLKVTAKKGNPTDKINDGFIDIHVEGGTPPYTYKWSNPSTSLRSHRAEGLTEGIDYEILITDTQQNSRAVTYRIAPKAIAEHFNGIFKPLVDNIARVMFGDPFSALGLYDPVIYAEEKRVPAPQWDATTNDKFVLEKWLKKEGEHVTKGDKIAIVSFKNGDKQTVSSPAEGTLKYLVKENQVIFDANNPDHVIAQGAHFLAEVRYDTHIALKHPNGDIQKKNIPFIVVWLILGALFFTFKMRFINLRGFRHAIDLARGKYDDPDAPGSVTHFQALTTAVSGTVGLGNIASVAIAISLGGAGATFWMILAGFLGMSSKFVECTLGVKYRNITEDGRVFGGPMNYLRYGLEKRNMKGLGKFLAALFAVLAILASFGGGNMFQANQSFEQLTGQFPELEGHGPLFGLFIAALVGVVIIGGIRSIARVTEKVVPVMASVYIIGCLVVIGMNIENIGTAFSAIIDGAFTPSALKGGVVGVLIVGFQRAAFSNEAGIGSASIAHSTAKTNHPTSEGFVALLEPLIDTIIVCTLTALVLIFTGRHEVEGITGAQLTSDAFGSVLYWFPYILVLAVFLFALSTMISWSYYGMRAWTYLFGKSKKSELIYKLIFLVFVVIGASVSLGAVLDFSDMMILAMGFPNIVGLLIMSGEVRKDLREYMQKLRAGELFKKQTK